MGFEVYGVWASGHKTLALGSRKCSVPIHVYPRPYLPAPIAHIIGIRCKFQCFGHACGGPDAIMGAGMDSLVVNAVVVDLLVGPGMHWLAHRMP